MEENDLCEKREDRLEGGESRKEEEGMKRFQRLTFKKCSV